jgi:hypothetical protein
MMAERVQKYLSHVDDAVTLSANTADVLSIIVSAQVPRGLAWVIPGKFPLILKLQASGGSEITITSKFYFGLMVPSEPDLVFNVGSKNYYHPWADLTIAQQRDADYQHALMVDFGIDFLALQEEEKLVIRLISPDVIDTSLIRFYIPYFERNPDEIDAELSYRAEWLKV